MHFLKNKYTKNALALVVVGGVGYFFYASLQQNLERVRQISFEFNLYSVLAILLFVLAVIVSGWLWGNTLNTLTKGEKHTPLSEATRVHISSWLLKYIPGQAGSLVNKIVWAKKNGYSKKLALITFAYENAFLLTASFLPAIPILLFFIGGQAFMDNTSYLLVPLLALLPLFLIANKRAFSNVMSFVFRKTVKQNVDESFFLSNKDSLRLQFLFLIPRIINGVAFVLIAISFLDIIPEAYVPLAAAFTLAGAIGILAIFVPSGIGVREAVIVIFAVSYMPVEQAIILSLVARLYTTIADGILAVLFLVLKLQHTRKMEV